MWPLSALSAPPTPSHRDRADGYTRGVRADSSRLRAIGKRPVLVGCLVWNSPRTAGLRPQCDAFCQPGPGAGDFWALIVGLAVATRYCKPSIQLSPIGGKGDCLLSLRERIEVRDSGSRLRDNEVAVKAHARSALCRNQRPLAALPAPPAPPHRVRAAVRPTKPAAPCGSGFNPTVLTFIAVLCRAAVRPTKPALSVGRVLTRRF